MYVWVCIYMCVHHPSLNLFTMEIFKHPVKVELIVQKKSYIALADVAQLVGGLSHEQKGQGFDSQSGHISRSRV